MSVGLKINGVAGTPDSGNGVQLQSYINSISDGDTLSIAQGGVITLASKLTFPAGRTVETILTTDGWPTIFDRYQTNTTDTKRVSRTFETSMALIQPAALNVFNGGNISAVFDAAHTCKNWTLYGLRLYPQANSTSYNVVGLFYPDGYDWGAELLAPRTEANLADNNKMIQCLLNFGPEGANKIYQASSWQTIKYLSKSFAFLGCNMIGMRGVGGQGDGYTVYADFALGPVEIDNNYIEAAGENSGFGGHGFTGGSGDEFSTPPFEYFWSREISPLRDGYTLSRNTITRNKDLWFPDGVQDHAQTLAKNLTEIVQGENITIRGNDYSNFWHDSGQQWYLMSLKLSTMNRPVLNYLQIRNVVIEYNVFRSMAQFLLFAYNANAANPGHDNIILRHNYILDVDPSYWGAAGHFFTTLGFLAPMSNVKIHNNFFDVLNTNGFAEFDHGTLASRKITGFEFYNNFLVMPGNHGKEFSSAGINAPVTTLFGGNPLTYGCFDQYFVAPSIHHNVIVTRTPDLTPNPMYFQWGGYNLLNGVYTITVPPGFDFTDPSLSNWFFEEVDGRDEVLALFEDATNADILARNYELTTAAKAIYKDADDVPIGPDWDSFRDIMGPDAYPFTPPANPPSGGIRLYSADGLPLRGPTGKKIRTVVSGN